MGRYRLYLCWRCRWTSTVNQPLGPMRHLPLNMWDIRWGVDECAGRRSKFIRHISIEWCRGKGGIEGLSAVLIRLALPNCAPAVGLVIEQPQYGQLSVISPPCITPRGQTSLACPTSPSARLPNRAVTNRKALLNLRIVACCSLKRTQVNPMCPPRILIRQHRQMTGRCGPRSYASTVTTQLRLPTTRHVTILESKFASAYQISSKSDDCGLDIAMGHFNSKTDKVHVLYHVMWRNWQKWIDRIYCPVD